MGHSEAVPRHSEISNVLSRDGFATDSQSPTYPVDVMVPDSLDSAPRAGYSRLSSAGQTVHHCTDLSQVAVIPMQDKDFSRSRR